MEDETWFTFAELQEQSPSAPISLNLSDETQSAFAEERRMAQVGRISENQESNLPQVGDRVRDENPPDWATDLEELEVVEVLSDVRADEYVIQGPNEGTAIDKSMQRLSDETVADANPSYDEDEPVVLAKYERGDSDEYAFPASRLSEQ